MPIIRKVMDLRTSRAICLPKSWLEYFEKESGQEINEVAIEVDNFSDFSDEEEREGYSMNEASDKFQKLKGLLDSLEGDLAEMRRILKGERM
jgi:hypothetical protein